MTSHTEMMAINWSEVSFCPCRLLTSCHSFEPRLAPAAVVLTSDTVNECVLWLGVDDQGGDSPGL